jgi:uncharacterized SAM-binding protein YcdF (DUF218 family)
MLRSALQDVLLYKSHQKLRFRPLFFILSKTLDFVLLPALWMVGLLLGALVSKPGGVAQRRWLQATAAFFLLGTNNALVNEAFLAWEKPPVLLSAVAPADAVVLLTGVTRSGKSPHDRVYLGHGADRVTNTLWLYRSGRARRIIISGGSSAVLDTSYTEVGQLATLLRLGGVPKQDLLLEERSRNTHENALFTRQLLTQHTNLKSLILVTSAFHQQRAIGCFAKVGLHPQPFPADFYSSDRSWTPDYWLVPDIDALSRWSLLLHELSGYFMYKMAGYC